QASSSSDNTVQLATTYRGDITAPVITLTGGNLTLECGPGPFTEPGFSALDDFQGDLSGSVVVGGDAVDVAKLGTYIITYNVSDS
ncbi:MAG: immunoglobulin-like domain-containing protein, partial [Verrucomicrobiales bacterium]